jgi:hypothetical protein
MGALAFLQIIPIAAVLRIEVFRLPAELLC